LSYTFQAEAFFYLHVINAFEENDHCIVDICCYEDPAMIDCMYFDSLQVYTKIQIGLQDFHDFLQGAQMNPDYASMFKSRPERFRLPLTSKKMCTDKVVPGPLGNFGCETPQIHREKFLGKPYRYFYAISSDVELDNPGTVFNLALQNDLNLISCF
jgi:carotenoid isomerooxygenase